MTNSKKTSRPSTEPVDKGNKRYLARLIQQEEAEEEINDYLANEGNPDRFDGERPVDRERSSGKLS